MRIDIDFLAGSHGNFLEFVLNKILLGETLAQPTPFNALGASHIKSKNYLDQRVFFSDHYHERKFYNSTADYIVSIQITEDDLLPLSLVSLLRAGDYNISPKQLEIDTYGKFNNFSYRHLITKINEGFGSVAAYNDIKADSWPCINNVEEFGLLPSWIQRECLDEFGIKLFYLSEKTPNCPKHILREFFKIGFLNPHQQGFWELQNRMNYPPDVQLYVFPYSAFYSEIEFKKHVYAIFEEFKLTPSGYDVSGLYSEFISKQIYANSKKECDDLVEMVFNSVDIPLPNLTVLHEAYIDAMLERRSGKEMPVLFDEYFKTTGEIYRFLCNEI